MYIYFWTFIAIKNLFFRDIAVNGALSSGEVAESGISFVP